MARIPCRPLRRAIPGAGERALAGLFLRHFLHFERQAVILDAEGREVARVVYRPDRPLPCGARCWVETGLRVVVLA